MTSGVVGVACVACKARGHPSLATGGLLCGAVVSFRCLSSLRRLLMPCDCSSVPQKVRHGAQLAGAFRRADIQGADSIDGKHGRAGDSARRRPHEPDLHASRLSHHRDIPQPRQACAVRARGALQRHLPLQGRCCSRCGCCGCCRREHASSVRMGVDVCRRASLCVDMCGRERVWM